MHEQDEELARGKSAPGSNPQFWLDRNVYVTGASGLLGGWLVEELAQRGANVIVLLRDGVRKSRLWKLIDDYDLSVVRGCVEEYELQERIINEYEVDSVFHLAAQTIVQTANRNPLSTFESNIKGTWTILEAARRVSTVRRIVVASSDKAYGTQKQLPYNEEMSLIGEHPYDVSKSCADLICASYFKSYELPVCVTRCGNFFGGGDLNFNRIVPGTIRSALRGERPIIRSDGKLVRDYIYIREGALAYMHLAEAMERPEIHGEAFNFSTGKPQTVLELVNTILTSMGSDLTPDVQNWASNEIREQYLDSTKANEVLGWRPRISQEDAFKETIAWYRDFLGREPS